LVERNLAKVEVESSRLFSRSRFGKKEADQLPFFVTGNIGIEQYSGYKKFLRE
jgi:hypothetical protein